MPIDGCPHVSASRDLRKVAGLVLRKLGGRSERQQQGDDGDPRRRGTLNSLTFPYWAPVGLQYPEDPLFSLAVAATAFGLIFVGELPDKTAVASLVLGSRYRPAPVLIGVCTAFALHVVVACALGGLIGQLPHRPIEGVTALLFLVGAVLLFRSNPDEAREEGERNADKIEAGGHRRIAFASFGVVLVAEFGDLTQLLTAGLAARYHQPLSVGVGALLALWSVAAIAVLAGRSLLRVVPLRRVQQLAAVVLSILAIIAALSAIKG
jgi:putative Ca2+/H+ antiporter (TMEM165/GDT1 family)